MEGTFITFTPTDRMRVPFMRSRFDAWCP